MRNGLTGDDLTGSRGSKFLVIPAISSVAGLTIQRKVNEFHQIVRGLVGHGLIDDHENDVLLQPVGRHREPQWFPDDPYLCHLSVTGPPSVTYIPFRTVHLRLSYCR